MTSAYLDSLQIRLKDRTRARRRKGANSRCRFRPTIDHLEKRNLLASFAVVNPIDGADGSLRHAIEQANLTTGPDTVVFDLAVEEIQVSGQIVITDDLTIKGPGADKLSVNGDGDRVFAVVPSKYAAETDLFTRPTAGQLADAPEVEIQRLTIANGTAFNAPGLPLDSGFSFGGGIYNLGSTVHLDRVHMTANTAVGAVTAGGAVGNEFGGTLTVSRSHFDQNASAGAVIAVGGAITSDLGRTDDGTEEGEMTQPPVVSVDRSSFVGNTAQAQLLGYLGDPFTGIGGGGAILNVTGAMTITRSHFESNAATGGPGDAGLLSGGAGFGGAILSGDISPFGAAESSLVVSNSTFVANTATGGSSAANDVPGGIAAGGAISVGNGSDARLKRNTFDSNAAIGGTGGLDANGGIATGGGVSGAGFATLQLNRNKFIENSARGGSGGGGNGQNATGRGGGLGLDSISLAGFAPGTATASSQSDSFLGNVAYGGIGGGIYNEGDLTLKKSQLKDNQAIGSPDVGIDFVAGYTFLGSALGGGISNVGSLDMSQVNLKSNQAIGADGAIGLLALVGGIGNYPGLAVGGDANGSIPLPFDVPAAHLPSGGIGGGILVYQGEADITTTVIINNLAKGREGGVGAGGGVSFFGFVGLVDAELSHSVVVNNTAVGGTGGNGLGGGIAIGGLDSLFAANFPGVPNVVVDIQRTAVIGNTAQGGTAADGLGGGIYNGNDADTELARSKVFGNRALGGLGGDGIGGGIYNLGELEEIHSAIFGNLASTSDDDCFGC